ncbi:MAG: penicillin-binding protein 1A, partial [Parvicella sp.]
LQVASAYGTLANGGLKKRPYLIESISDRDGNYVSKFESSCDICSILDPQNRPFTNLNDADADVRAMTVESNYLIRNMMQKVITQGTGKRALALNRTDLAGKTGTTNDYNDAWFSGFSPQVVTSVWVGFDQPSYLGRRESGAGAALPIWVEHMGNVLKDYPEQPIPQPVNITTAYIDKDTGGLLPADSPNGYWEVFKLGSEPTTSSAAVTSNSTSTTVEGKETEELF